MKSNGRLFVGLFGCMILIVCIVVAVLYIEFNTETDMNKTDNEPDVSYITTDNTNHISFDSVEELYDYCDYVVVASPEEDYADSKQVWRDSGNKDTNEVSDVDLGYSYTERVHKINKVYKGDNEKLKEIIVCEAAYSDGETVYVREGDYIAEKNNEYLLFLKESNTEDGKYFTCDFQGKYNLDASKNDGNKQIDRSMLELVKEKYKSDFSN